MGPFVGVLAIKHGCMMGKKTMDFFREILDMSIATFDCQASVNETDEAGLQNCGLIVDPIDSIISSF